MPSTNIQSINYSDDQNQIIGKINSNFDEIVELHGGSQGIVGPTGSTGEVGDVGNQGNPGTTGARGTRWFVQSIQPSGPGTTVVAGDFWVDSSNGDIYIFDSTGWTFTGYSISSGQSIFKSTSSNWVGGTGDSVLFNQILPEDYLFILADKVSNSGVLNETLSKFMISMDTSINDGPILEFSKSNLEDGTISDYSQHPVFKWRSQYSADQSLLLQIPGGSFIFGSSGGFLGNFQTLTASSLYDFSIDYGTSVGSGIFSTGGFYLNSPYGTFTIESNFFNITGGSGDLSKTVQLNPNLQAGVPSIYSYSNNAPGALSTERSASNFNELSHSVYHLLLETTNGPEFSIDTKGKILTKKIESGISYASSNAGATSSVNGDPVSWYFISRSDTRVASSILQFGNTIVLTPSVPANNYIGVGVYSDPTYSWSGTGGLDPGQSIDINVLYSPNTRIAGISQGIKYIGYGATSGDATNAVTLPFLATSIDLTIAKGPIGGATTVFYRAFGPFGGSGGSFSI